MGFTLEAKEDRIPSYEESTQFDTSVSTSQMPKTAWPTSPPANQTLQARLANVRTMRINAIISSYIDPLLESQAIEGLYKTTIVLVPSSSSSIQTTDNSYGDVLEGSGASLSKDSKEAVVGFPEEDYVKFVRLHGEDHSMQFWRQPAVIKELEISLKARLVASGHEVHDSEPVGEPQLADVPTIQPPPVQSRPRAKPSLFRKKIKEIESRLQPLPAPPALPVFKLQPGHVKLGIRLSDVTLRIVTDLGLYDTKTGKALVINMEIGS